MLLTFITNDPVLACAADHAGIDRVMVDLERLGKARRQVNRSLFLSDHHVSDVGVVRSVASRAQVIVRIDPIHPGSRGQIECVVGQGADVVMLPYFHRLNDVAEFLDLLDGRASAALLVETAGSLAILPELCRLPHVAEIHIGLNDLSISLRKQSHFDVIADGTVTRACHTLRDSGIPFGFGGIGSLSRRDLPISPELMLAAQVCQGSTRGWLGRTFRDVPLSRLAWEVASLREAIDRWTSADQLDRDLAMSQLCSQIVAQSRQGPLNVSDTARSQMEIAFAPGSGVPSTRSPR